MTEKVDAIFIHSLWRSGSTYFFDKFRRAQAGYFTYQEPLHETMLSAVTNRNLLLQASAEVSGTLRHPNLSDSYYAEAHQTYDLWQDFARKSFIYDGYFVNPLDEDLRRFLVALIGAAPTRAVIQECRTSARIEAIKNGLDSSHIYIWRNPRDQWWSLKINIYFDVVLQMILNAKPHPQVIAAFRERIGFRSFHASTIGEEQSHFCRHPLSAKDGYAAFFLLWCLAWIEGDTQADITINLDLLSISDDYKRLTEISMTEKGIFGLTFEDCKMHCAPFTDLDLRFFEPIEKDIYNLLGENGVPTALVARLEEARRFYAPKTQPISALHVDAGVALEALERTRAISLRLQDQCAGEASGHEVGLDRIRAQGAAREREIEERLAATIEQIQAELAAAKQEASTQLAEMSHQLAAKDQQLTMQINLLVHRDNKIRELEEIAHAAKTTLEHRLHKVEDQAKELIEQRDRLLSRAQETEFMLSEILDGFREATEEISRLQSSWIIRWLTKMRILPHITKRNVPGNGFRPSGHLH